MVIGMSMNVGAPFWVAVPLALGAALLVGGFNGTMIAHVGMPPFVVTLGMLSIARSLAMVLSNNRMVYEFGPDQAQLLALGGGSSTSRSLPTDGFESVILLACVVTGSPSGGRAGATLFAIGGNERAAAAAYRSDA
jgi:ribose transport system permease protein